MHESDLSSHQFGDQHVGVIGQLAQAVEHLGRSGMTPPRSGQAFAKDKGYDVGQGKILLQEEPLLAQDLQEELGVALPPHGTGPERFTGRTSLRGIG